MCMQDVPSKKTVMSDGWKLGPFSGNSFRLLKITVWSDGNSITAIQFHYKINDEPEQDSPVYGGATGDPSYFTLDATKGETLSKMTVWFIRISEVKTVAGLYFESSLKKSPIFGQKTNDSKETTVQGPIKGFSGSATSTTLVAHEIIQ